MLESIGTLLDHLKFFGGVLMKKPEALPIGRALQPIDRAQDVFRQKFRQSFATCSRTIGARATSQAANVPIDRRS